MEVHRSHIIKCCQSVLVVGRHRFEARIAERNSETTRSGGVVPLRHPALYQPSPQSIFAPTLLSLPTTHSYYPHLTHSDNPNLLHCQYLRPYHPFSCRILDPMPLRCDIMVCTPLHLHYAPCALLLLLWRHLCRFTHIHLACFPEPALTLLRSSV